MENIGIGEEQYLVAEGCVCGCGCHCDCWPWQDKSGNMNNGYSGLRSDNALGIY